MQKKWVIVFLVYADFREKKGFVLDETIVEELVSLFEDLRDCRLQDEVSVFVIINRVRYIRQGDKAVTNDRTFVYELVPAAAGKNKLVNYEPLMGELEGRQLPHSVESLSNIFKVITSNVHAEHSLLVTWDHGNIFGIFNIDAAESDIIRPVSFEPFERFADRFNDLSEFWMQLFTANEFLKNEPANPLFDAPLFTEPIYRVGHQQFIIPNQSVQFYSGFNKLVSDKALQRDAIIQLTGDTLSIRYAAADATKTRHQLESLLEAAEWNALKPVMTDSGMISISGPVQKIDGIIDILTNEELAEAIRTGFEKKKADVLLMMNCSTMNIHAMYAYHQSVDFLVAPQGIISNPGYNYLAILNGLAQEGKLIDPERLVRLCADSTFDFTDARRRQHETAIAKWAIFSLDLRDGNALPELARTINGLAAYLIDNWDQLGAQVINARGRCVRFDDAKNLDFNVIDITHFIALLLKRIMDIEDLHHHRTPVESFLVSINAQRDSMKLLGKETGNTIYLQDWIDPLELDITIAASGVGIYFPVRLVRAGAIFNYFVAANAPGASNFLQQQDKWLPFLDKL